MASSKQRHFQRLLDQAVSDRGDLAKNKGGLATRHYLALTAPFMGPESALVQMLRGWAKWAEQHRERYESPVGHDHVIGMYWMQIGFALHEMLCADVGRLDCGSLSRWLLETAELEGVNLETQKLRQDLPGEGS